MLLLFAGRLFMYTNTVFRMGHYRQRSEIYKIFARPPAQDGWKERVRLICRGSSEVLVY
jgi:hypothetical protein